MESNCTMLALFSLASGLVLGLILGFIGALTIVKVTIGQYLTVMNTLVDDYVDRTKDHPPIPTKEEIAKAVEETIGAKPRKARTSWDA